MQTKLDNWIIANETSQNELAIVRVLESWCRKSKSTNRLGQKFFFPNERRLAPRSLTEITKENYDPNMSEEEMDARNRRFNRNQNRQAQNPGQQQQQQQNVAGASTQANQQYYSGGQQGIVFGSNHET